MSTRDDVPSGRSLEPAALDRLWDAMNRQIAPVGGRTGSASITAADTIRRLGEHDDAPHASARQIDAIWMAVAAQTLPGTIATSPDAPAHQGVELEWRLLALLQTVVRQTAIGAIAGFLVGMLVVGGMARLFMRFVAVLSPERLDGAVTNNGNQVGVITLSGTFELLFFGGAFPGLLGGIAVMAVRPWLPASGWRRYLLAGAIGFAVAAPMVLESGENPDYKRFGIFGINVCLFTLLPFFFGIAVVPVIDTLDRRVPRSLPSFRQGPVLALASLPMFLLTIPLLPLALVGLSLEPAGLLLLLPVIRVLAPFWVKHAPTLEERHRRELRGARIGYVALAAPCLLGLILMAQSLARLL
jgi:hypothetical protein